jgi:diguanylate cyclase (GGDEF)-like protein
MAGGSFSGDRALVALLDALDEGALVFDETYRCRLAGRRAAELLGVEPRALVGLGRAEILERFAAGAREPEAVLAALRDESVADASTAVDPIQVDRPHARTVAWSSVPILDGEKVGRIDVLRDVTRERRAEEKLEEVSLVDDASGLVNRRGFEQGADREHRRSQRAWLSYAIVRLRVEGLETARARGAGDELVKRIGEELRASRREYDVVARWEDGEIAMLLPGADAAATRNIIKRCAVAVDEKVRDLVEGAALTIGAAVWIPPSGDGAVDMIRRAGEALAAAVALGRGAMEIDAGFGGFKDEIEV